LLADDATLVSFESTPEQSLRIYILISDTSFDATMGKSPSFNLRIYILFSDTSFDAMGKS